MPGREKRDIKIDDYGTAKATASLGDDKSGARAHDSVQWYCMIQRERSSIVVSHVAS